MKDSNKLTKIFKLIPKIANFMEKNQIKFLNVIKISDQFIKSSKSTSEIS